ncbi:formin-like protein 18 [Corvus cornix cornix]|uniref:formin-like protein 18 n=1 Tax=Corvus cornix cornix TaxID=932674 RepID=UPI0019524906|nr:formin-like protein 18 [Corvus cornix cornix]
MGKKRALRGKQGEEREERSCPASAGSGQGFLGLQHHPPIPATEPEENAPSRWHGGLLCPPHLRHAGGAQPRSSIPPPPAGDVPRGCGSRLPAAPCAADPPPLLLSGASVLGGGCQDGRWGLPSLPGRREHRSSVPLTLPPRSVLGAAGPAPAPAPPQGSGRPKFAPSSAHLRARRRSAPGRSEADRHSPELATTLEQGNLR